MACCRKSTTCQVCKNGKATSNSRATATPSRKLEVWFGHLGCSLPAKTAVACKVVIQNDSLFHYFDPFHFNSPTPIKLSSTCGRLPSLSILSRSCSSLGYFAATRKACRETIKTFQNISRTLSFVIFLRCHTCSIQKPAFFDAS